MKPLQLVFLIAGFALHATATPLTGSGSNLPLPATGPTTPGIVPALTIGSGSFSGIWSAPALGPWQGSFTATGNYPGGAAGPGTSRWEFSGLAAGELPSGTYFTMWDVDRGSGGNESFTLRAYDATNTLITGSWLDNPVFLSGPNPLDFVASAMPGWSFVGGSYTFDGATVAVAGNPAVTVSLLSNQAISFLEVDKTDFSYGFGLNAPQADVPEPGSLALVIIALGAAGLLRKGR